MLSTKFIKGTNKQYSIREDGKVFNNFYYSTKIRNKKIIRNIPKELKGYIHNKTTTFELRVNNEKSIYRTINSLLYKHFHQKRILEESKILKKQKDILKSKENKEKITKLYVSNCLNIPINQLSEELYQHHKKTILLKRQICKKHNLHMSSFNNY